MFTVPRIVVGSIVVIAYSLYLLRDSLAIVSVLQSVGGVGPRVDGIARSHSGSHEANHEGMHESQTNRTKIESFFFLHIPKTGTSFFTTLRNYLDACKEKDYSCNGLFGGGFWSFNARNDSYNTSQQHLDQTCGGKLIGCTFKHYHSRWSPGLQTRNVVTMLRNPVDLGISYWRWEGFNNLRVSAEKRDNLTYLDEMYYNHWNESIKIRFEFLVADINIISALSPHNKTLHDAEVTLFNQIKFYGITEYWNETVCLFHSTFGGEPRPSQYINTRNQGFANSIAPRLQTRLEEILSQELILYSAAKERFLSRAKEAGCMS